MNNIFSACYNKMFLKKCFFLTSKYRLWLGLGKLRKHTGGPGGLPPGLGLGQFRNHTRVAKQLKSTFIGYGYG